MGLLIDLGILLIILLTTFLCYKKGFIKLAFRLLSFVLALVIALLLYQPISNFILNNTSIPSKIEAKISDRISTEDNETANSIVSNYYNDLKNSSLTVVAHNMTNTIINISSALIVFIVTRILLLFLRFSTNLIAKLPLIKQFNHILGFLYGIILGFFIIYLLFTIITLLSPIIDLNNVISLINSSIIGNIMYNNNIIFMFLV